MYTSLLQAPCNFSFVDIPFNCFLKGIHLEFRLKCSRSVACVTGRIASSYCCDVMQRPVDTLQGTHFCIIVLITYHICFMT